MPGSQLRIKRRVPLAITRAHGGFGVAPAAPVAAAPVTVISVTDGGNGGPGTSRHYHTQSSAAAAWTVAHNLGFRPSVSVTTTGGVETLGGEVVHLSAVTLQIIFDVPFAGFAHCT